MGSPKDMRLKTSRAYDLKLSLRDFWNFRNPVLAESYLKKWYFVATRSRLAPVSVRQKPSTITGTVAPEDSDQQKISL